FEKMVRDLSGALVDGLRIETLDRVRDSSVQLLLTRGRDAGKQGLTHQFMAEGKRPFRPLGARHDYSHLLRLLDDRKKLINVDLADPGQKLKAETASDHRGGCQHPLFILVEPFKAAADDQPHVFRNVDFVDLDVRSELAGRIKHFPLFDQMPVHLLDEEWISL